MKISVFISPMYFCFNTNIFKNIYYRFYDRKNVIYKKVTDLGTEEILEDAPYMDFFTFCSY